MRSLIGPELIRKLTARERVIFDTKLTGFSIRCRASGTHAYRYTLGRGHIVTLGRVGVMPVTEARAAAEALQSEVSRRTVERLSKDPKLTARSARAQERQALRSMRGTRRRTWKAFVDEYERLATGDMKSARETLRRLRTVFGGWFGDETRLDAISTFEIERWRASRRKDKVRPATINRDLDSLRAALNWAVSVGLLGSNPAAKIKRVKADHTAPVRYLTDAEETRLRAALVARDDRRKADRASANRWRRERGYDELPPYGHFTDYLHPFTILALNSGARRGELFNLKWADVDLDARHVMTLRGGGTKNGQTREIPLNAEAVKVLSAWRPTTADRADYVFPGDDGGRMVSLKTAWLALVRRAKVPTFRFHDCRHCFASRLVQAGVDLAVVRELLGHSTFQVTLRYASFQPQHRAAAVATLVRP
jgi:integrase